MESKQNTTVETAENAAATAKKTTKAKPKAQRVKPSHPATSEMVTAAIRELKDKKGSSLPAIKKYIASTYKVDGEKLAPFIKRYLKSALASGAVVQTKGKGVSGSFKLPSVKSAAAAKPKKEAAKKPAPKKTQSTEKKVAVKKTSATKKPAVTKKPAAEKKAVAPKKTATKPAAAKPKAKADVKTLSKAKKNAKAPAAKTKTPKPKKAAAPKSAKATSKK